VAALARAGNAAAPTAATDEPRKRRRGMGIDTERTPTVKPSQTGLGIARPVA
jgi:hypothetical protein